LENTSAISEQNLCYGQLIFYALQSIIVSYILKEVVSKGMGGGLFRVHNRKISTTQTTIKIRMIRKLDKTAS